MQVKLKVLRGSSAGKEIRIPGTTFRIGRAENCQLRPKSDSISRDHCEINLRDDKVFIQDLGSRNGTLVNDVKVESNDEVELQMGNQIRVGRLEFEIVISHGLDAGKRKKVADVKEAAARTTAKVDAKAADDDITGWLEEGDNDTRAKTIADPETRQFQLDETDRIALENATGEEDSELTDEAGGKSGSSWFRKKQSPKKLGKLPDKPRTTTDNSCDAAADMLKKFFNRS
jgi:pSer/pThr/pTyr-binding forkhead associated (FHA) protein